MNIIKIITTALEKLVNKQNSLATDVTNEKYPTVTAVRAHTTDTANPHSVTKAQVGLSNVDNTSDVSKPISTATQTALNSKVTSVVAGANVTVDNTDPLNPIVSSTGGGGGGSLEINVSPITGGTNGGILFQNAGTLGQSSSLNYVSGVLRNKAQGATAGDIPFNIEAFGSTASLFKIDGTGKANAKKLIVEGAVNVNYIDVNTITEGGFYDGFQCPNSPDVNGYFYYLVERHSADSQFMKMTATSFGVGTGAIPNQTFIRVKVSGTWGAWMQVNQTKAINKTGVDFNTITEGGSYDAFDSANAPTAGFYYLFVERYNSNDLFVKQTATSFGSGNVANITYIRVRVIGTWTPWKKLLTE